MKPLLSCGMEWIDLEVFRERSVYVFSSLIAVDLQAIHSLPKGW